MKKTCLTLLAALAICLSANAQKVYSGDLLFYYNKRHETRYKVNVNNAKTIAEKKAGKKYIVSVLKKFYGNDFFKEGIDHVDVTFLTYCVDDLKTYLKELGPRWRPHWIKPQYLKKDYLIVFTIVYFEGASCSSYNLGGVYNIKTGRVYGYNEASGENDEPVAPPP